MEALCSDLSRQREDRKPKFCFCLLVFCFSGFLLGHSIYHLDSGALDHQRSPDGFDNLGGSNGPAEDRREGLVSEESPQVGGRHSYLEIDHPMQALSTPKILMEQASAAEFSLTPASSASSSRRTSRTNQPSSPQRLTVLGARAG